jgi:hypothetical protein
MGVSPAAAGLLGGMGGGIAQAYATMGPSFPSFPFISHPFLTTHNFVVTVGFCTTMKTVEITRHKQSATGVKPASTMAVFMDIYRREGLAGINKGVNAVAIRQCTNWGSRSVSSLSPPFFSHVRVYEAVLTRRLFLARGC